MSEDTTQPEVEEISPEEGQEVETTEEGVEDVGESQQETTEEVEDAQTTSAFEELKAKKGFESEEDLASAYKNLESEFSKRSEGLKTAEERAEAAEKILEAMMAETDTEDGYVDESLEREVRGMKASLDMERIQRKHPDFADYADAIREEVTNMTPEQRAAFQNEKGLDLLYKMAKIKAAEKEVAQAKEAGRKETTVQEYEKIKASVADGNKAKKTSQAVWTREDINNMSTEEYQKNEEKILELARQGLIK